MRGSIMDITLIFILLIIMVVAFFSVTKVFNSFSEAANKTLAGYDTDIQNKTNIANDDISVGLTALNLGIPIVIFGLILGAVIFVYFVPTHPAFIPAAIILLIIFAVMSVLFSNVLGGFLTDSPLSEIGNDNPIVVGIINYLPHIIIVAGLLIIVIMYGRPTEQ